MYHIKKMTKPKQEFQSKYRDVVSAADHASIVQVMGFCVVTCKKAPRKDKQDTESKLWVSIGPKYKSQAIPAVQNPEKI